jgi:adenylate kinase family enzyme
MIANKIMIIGCGGSGKSTLARKLHRITGLPLIHLDRLYWQPGWVEPTKEDWRKIMEEQTDRPAWIMDGNYGGTMDIRLEKADLIIFMDRSRWLCLYRILKRQLQYIGRTRPDMTEGCVERVSWEFVQYVYRYNDTRRPGILEKLEGYEKEKQVFILKNENQIKRFLLNIAEV